MEKYTSLGDTNFSDDEDLASERASENERMEALERYSYFNIDQIIKSASIPKEAWTKGKELLNRGTFAKIRLETGYSPSDNVDGQLCQVSWEGGDNRTSIQTTIVFSKTSLRKAHCNCPTCLKQHGKYNLSWYYDYGMLPSQCEYVAGLLLTAQKSLKEQNFGDATDMAASNFLHLCLSGRANTHNANSLTSEKSVMLRPRLLHRS